LHIQYSALRDEYRRWRQGALKRFKGDVVAEDLKLPMATDLSILTRSVSLVFNDVVADEQGRPTLVPIDGPSVAGTPVEDFPADALVTIRVFRFFENHVDEKEVWERELRNVNSGCILWLPVQLTPGMHSKAGSKYGIWFTIHYIQVYARHFKSAYHMCNEGCSYPAKSFGSTSATKDTINAQPLERGYFWFVSPASDDSSASEQNLSTWGWKHVAREGPYNGTVLTEEWRKRGAPCAIQDLQGVLDEVRRQAHSP
jgi:hypothetical protein